jgi:magnesium chelatase subunit I
MRLSRGILARADRNLLYVDEINLLVDEIIDAILDAASQGTYSVHRGPLTATYRARLVLIGSMNPEEGRLRPQILDRFGLRVVTRGLKSKEERLEAYRRSIAFHTNPRRVVLEYAETLDRMRLEVVAAREALPTVRLSPQAERVGLRIIQSLGIDSLRAEITLFEAARAHAVADGRQQATPADVRSVAPMTLRLRRSAFMHDFFQNQSREESELRRLIGAHDGRRPRKAASSRKKG